MIKHQRCCAAHINRIGAFGQSRDGMGQLGANVVEPGYEKNEPLDCSVESNNSTSQ